MQQKKQNGISLKQNVFIHKNRLLKTIITAGVQLNYHNLLFPLIPLIRFYLRRTGLKTATLSAVAVMMIGAHSMRSSDALLLLYPSVLEPDLDLFLGQLQTIGDLDPSQPGQVHVIREFTLQLQQLLAAERCPRPLDS